MRVVTLAPGGVFAEAKKREPGKRTRENGGANLGCDVPVALCAGKSLLVAGSAFGFAVREYRRRSTGLTLAHVVLHTVPVVAMTPVVVPDVRIAVPAGRMVGQHRAVGRGGG